MFPRNNADQYNQYDILYPLPWKHNKTKVTVRRKPFWNL